MCLWYVGFRSLLVCVLALHTFDTCKINEDLLPKPPTHAPFSLVRMSNTSVAEAAYANPKFYTHTHTHLSTNSQFLVSKTHINTVLFISLTYPIEEKTAIF